MDRERLVDAATLLLRHYARRAWNKPKNAQKDYVPPLAQCIEHIKLEIEEVEEALDRNHMADVIDELGDVAAWCGLTLWRAVYGDDA